MQSDKGESFVRRISPFQKPETLNEGKSREGLGLGNLGKLKVWSAMAEPAHKEETDHRP